MEEDLFPATSVPPFFHNQPQVDSRQHMCGFFSFFYQLLFYFFWLDSPLAKRVALKGEWQLVWFSWTNFVHFLTVFICCFSQTINLTQFLNNCWVRFLFCFFLLGLKTPWNLCKWAWNSRGIAAKKKNAENKRN